MEKQKTSSKRKAAIKVIVAVLLIAIMTAISFAVANFVHNRKSVQASSVKNGLSAYELAVQQGYAGSLMIGLFLFRVNRHIRLRR